MHTRLMFSFLCGMLAFPVLSCSEPPPGVAGNVQSDAIKQSSLSAVHYESQSVGIRSTSSGVTRSSVQCAAHTKKGNRCKRMTTSANGCCYQHGG